MAVVAVVAKPMARGGLCLERMHLGSECSGTLNASGVEAVVVPTPGS